MGIMPLGGVVIGFITARAGKTMIENLFYTSIWIICSIVFVGLIGGLS